MNETLELLKAIKHAVELLNAKVDQQGERIERMETNLDQLRRDNRETSRFLKGLAVDLDQTMDRIDRIEAQIPKQQ
jgi:septal ring factor EnvC (AmiA/AmiB activator)